MRVVLSSAVGFGLLIHIHCQSLLYIHVQCLTLLQSALDRMTGPCRGS